MYQPVLLKDRPRNARIVLAGVIPTLVGAVAGVLIGSSLTGYWVVAVVAGLGGVIAGFEHEDGWGGADRGVLGGFLYGVGLLVAHAIAGTHAKVSLGSFPPLFAVVTAIIGMFLGALGGRIGRIGRAPAGAPAGDPASQDGDEDDAPEQPTAVAEQPTAAEPRGAAEPSALAEPAMLSEPEA